MYEMNGLFCAEIKSGAKLSAKLRKGEEEKLQINKIRDIENF